MIKKIIYSLVNMHYIYSVMILSKFNHPFNVILSNKSFFRCVSLFDMYDGQNKLIKSIVFYQSVNFIEEIDKFFEIYLIT